ncbi:aquaporin-like [Aricia agestis]|uniref:aquaporin-like n=1 Tax=Aricia agestis TaxID=91739 RepID=UPI001C2047F3|nr:aquaporin-like [Aricia agestis]
MPNDDATKGVSGWVRRWWRAALAELVATALLVLLGVAALLPKDGRPPPLAHPALAFGFVIVANVEAFGAASGAHMNPAVTLAALLDRRLPAAAAPLYVLAQLLGATLGFAALMALAPAAFAAGAAGAAVGGTAAGTVSPAAAAVVEALLTGVLVLLCCGLWAAHDAGARDPAAPVKLGLTVAGLIYAGGEMTGASLNPARSFAPALLQHFNSDHWVYWVGPLGGSALATLLHRYALRPPAPRAPADARLTEALPLQDKAEP